MKKWDREEDEKEKVRYNVIMQENGTMKIVDLITGRVDWMRIDNLSLGGSGKASDYRDGFLLHMKRLEETENNLGMELKELVKKLPKDNFTSFFNKNFSWKEICESELGIRYAEANGK